MHRLTNCFPITNPALVSEVIETTVGLIIYSFIDPLDFFGKWIYIAIVCYIFI